MKIDIFSVISTSKQRALGRLYSNMVLTVNSLVSYLELCLNLTGGNVQLPAVALGNRLSEHCSLLRPLACKKKGKDFKEKGMFNRAVVSFL